MKKPKESPPISVLMYHQVGKFKSPKTHRSCYCDVGRFRAQMSWLKYAGYQVISLSDAYDALFADKVLTRRSVVLSFDDAYENFADHALPIMTEYDYPSALFAVSGLLGQPAEWLTGDREKPLLLSTRRLRELRKYNVEIGSHTINHPRLSRLQPEQVLHEVSDSRSALENILGEPVKFFAYPYGDYNPSVREAVERAGYLAAVTCSRGIANTSPNAFEIPRKAISYGDSIAGFFWKLAFKNKRKDRYE